MDTKDTKFTKIGMDFLICRPFVPFVPFVSFVSFVCLAAPVGL